ncbi:MAG TPA: RluA family pseudouridine synthase [Pseudobdellovibrionaceae bacterium]|nr:RluA family pseudouridine synthase [Pseudobdellovibrionaceae bacterium]
MHSNKILHLISQGPDSVLEVLKSQVGLSDERSRELFSLGALYLNKERIYDPETKLQAGDYLRIHSDPRRYRKPPNLESCLLAETADWWIVDKPSGISCHATVDNGTENLIAWLREDLNADFHITHRLDVPTSGCLVLGKTPESVRKFNKLQMNDLVQKEYEALVEGRLDLTGLVTHWMKKDQWAPREVYAEERLDTQRCDLEILESEFCGAVTRLRIRLLTGRTHQIRAQMKLLGHPVLNDVMYGAERRRDGEIIALRARTLAIETEPAKVLRVEAPIDWSSWLS